MYRDSRIRGVTYCVHFRHIFIRHFFSEAHTEFSDSMIIVFFSVGKTNEYVRRDIADGNEIIVHTNKYTP